MDRRDEHDRRHNDDSSHDRHLAGRGQGELPGLVDDQDLVSRCAASQPGYGHHQLGG